MPPSSVAPPTVAVDVRALVPRATGIGIYTQELLEALASRAALRYLAVSHRPPRTQRELVAAGIGVETQQAPLGVLWQQRALPGFLKSRGIDLLWSPLMTLPWHCPVPAVVTVHDLTTLTHPETHSLKVRLSLKPFLRRSLEQAARLVADSEATAADLRRFFPGLADKIRVIYLGVSQQLQPVSESERERIRAGLGLPGGYLLYVGTLEPRKNVGAVFDAWETLVARRSNVPPLVLAGAPGWKNEALLRRIATLEARSPGPKLHNLGHLDRPELVRLFQGATAFVYPSLYEGFGLPPAEAMACGVPVVTSDVSSLPEVVGEAGWQVPPRDTGALVAALEQILDDPEVVARRVEAGLRRVRRFTWEGAARQLEEVFFEVLQEARP